MTEPVSPEESSATVTDPIEQRVLEQISPSAELMARVDRVRRTLVERAEAIARSRGRPLVRALVAGSAARGTYIADRLDIDLFLLYPPDTPRSVLAEEGLALGRELVTQPEQRYAEHPYLRGEFEGFRVEAVPGYAIEDPSRPISAVDRTPFHQEYLAQRQTPEMVGQVRLTKQFLRGLGILGSEARTEGFSGYLVELLILRFGSLRGLLREARRWSIPTRLDASSRDPPRLPGEVALILPDPVDPGRNVASALSRAHLGLFILAAREYLVHPSEAWFVPYQAPRLPLEEALRRVDRRGTHVAVVELPRDTAVVDDTLYPQIFRAVRVMREALEREGFSVIGATGTAGGPRVIVVLETAESERPAIRVREGPPPGIDRVGEFLGKWEERTGELLQGPYLRPDGKLAVETRRETRRVEAILEALMPTLSLGRDLDSARQRSAAVYPLTGTTGSEPLERALADLLAKQLPWRSRST
ncbi:MAG: CCA tRNA nucleotidyltransferase [Thermoplasmata archaeon]